MIYFSGNQQLHVLTSQSWYELRIDLEDMSGNWRHARYNIFEIGGALTNYTITVGSYTGDAGNQRLVLFGLLTIGVTQCRRREEGWRQQPLHFRN